MLCVCRVSSRSLVRVLKRSREEFQEIDLPMSIFPASGIFKSKEALELILYTCVIYLKVVGEVKCKVLELPVENTVLNILP